MQALTMRRNTLRYCAPRDGDWIVYRTVAWLAAVVVSCSRVGQRLFVARQKSKGKEKSHALPAFPPTSAAHPNAQADAGLRFGSVAGLSRRAT